MHVRVLDELNLVANRLLSVARPLVSQSLSNCRDEESCVVLTFLLPAHLFLRTAQGQWLGLKVKNTLDLT